MLDRQMIENMMIAIQNDEWMDDNANVTPEQYEAAQNAFNALDDLLRVMENSL
mgnify:CR=1 FL=1|jgi:hypothetical protein